VAKAKTDNEALVVLLVLVVAWALLGVKEIGARDLNLGGIKTPLPSLG
jgi:hypothetical protein